MTNELGVDRYPTVAEVRSAMDSQRLETSSIPDFGCRSDVLTMAEDVMRGSQDNPLTPATVLRLTAHRYAAQDSAAAVELGRSGDSADPLHHHRNTGRSDGSPSADPKDGN